MLIALASATLSCGDDASQLGAGAGSSGGGGSGGEAGCSIPNRLLDDGRCLPPGVQDSGCPAGELTLDDGSCQPAGIPPEMCAPGFEAANQGCAPILPAEDCAFGLMAVPGELDCREVAPCGAGRWGDIPVDEQTEYVDGSHNGASDGSANAPWKSIADGISAAAPGALVAVAAGSYAEDLLIQGKPIRLWGACPALVEVVGSAGAEAAVEVASGAAGTELRGLAIRGDQRGIYLHDATEVLVEQVWVHDTAARGIRLLGEAAALTSATIRGVLVERCRGWGMTIAGSEALVEGVVVRDTQPELSGVDYGRGIELMANNDTDDFSSVVLRGSVLERNLEFGLFATGTHSTVEATVVRDNLPSAADQIAGRGINIQPFDGEPERSSLVMRGLVVERNYMTGIFSAGADVTIEHTVVRDTQPMELDETMGNGIETWSAPPTREPPDVAIRFCLVEGNHFSGISMSAVRASIEGVVLRDNLPQASDQGDGVGLKIQDQPEASESWSVSLRGSVVADNVTTGVVVAGADATLEGVLVRGTSAIPTSEYGGSSVTFSEGFSGPVAATGLVRASQLDGGYTIGLYVRNSQLTAEGIVVRDVQPARSSGSFGRGINVQHRASNGPPATLVLRDSLVEQSHDIGVAFLDADGTIERTVVRGTRPEVSSGGFGDGITVMAVDWPASIAVSHSLVEDNDRAGVSLFGAHGALSATRLACNPIALALEPTSRGSGSFDDLGENSCGCDAEQEPCVALSRGLEPPGPVEQP